MIDRSLEWCQWCRQWLPPDHARTTPPAPEPVSQVMLQRDNADRVVRFVPRFAISRGLRCYVAPEVWLATAELFGGAP